MTTMELPEPRDYLAPDGSEIRLLPTMKGGGLAHCTLPAGQVSRAVAHRRVEEIWYCIEGEGEVWRGGDDRSSKPVAVRPGTALTIEPGVSFQFRAGEAGDLKILIVTMPPWPGADEACEVDGYWER